jgi:hypothetical protein
MVVAWQDSNRLLGMVVAANLSCIRLGILLFQLLLLPLLLRVGWQVLTHLRQVKD